MAPAAGIRAGPGPNCTGRHRRDSREPTARDVGSRTPRRCRRYTDDSSGQVDWRVRYEAKNGIADRSCQPGRRFSFPRHCRRSRLRSSDPPKPTSPPLHCKRDLLHHSMPFRIRTRGSGAGDNGDTCRSGRLYGWPPHAVLRDSGFVCNTGIGRGLADRSRSLAKSATARAIPVL